MNNWISGLTNNNLLLALDVMIDMHEQVQISPNNVEVLFFNPYIKFYELYPVDAVNFRDEYSKKRKKITFFLAQKEIIKIIDIVKKNNLTIWDNIIQIKVENVENFNEVYKALKEEHSKRFSSEKIESKVIESLWDLIHPEIKNVSKKLFEDQHYSSCVENALKHLDNTIKQKFKAITQKEKSGKALMQEAFNEGNPIVKLSDLQTISDKDLQEGYKFLYMGAMVALRNPKAHEIIDIDESEAIHQLFIISHLMYVFYRSGHIN